MVHNYMCKKKKNVLQDTNFQGRDKWLIHKQSLQMSAIICFMNETVFMTDRKNSNLDKC